jgi:hypothetical protein
MISRPLSPLRNTTFNRPPPDAASFFVSQWMRNPPVSLVNDSVCLSPRPDHDPTRFHSCAGGFWTAVYPDPQETMNSGQLRAIS